MFQVNLFHDKINKYTSPWYQGISVCKQGFLVIGKIAAKKPQEKIKVSTRPSYYVLTVYIYIIGPACLRCFFYLEQKVPLKIIRNTFCSKSTASKMLERSAAA